MNKKKLLIISCIYSLSISSVPENNLPTALILICGNLYNFVNFIHFDCKKHKTIKNEYDNAEQEQNPKMRMLDYAKANYKKHTLDNEIYEYKLFTISCGIMTCQFCMYIISLYMNNEYKIVNPTLLKAISCNAALLHTLSLTSTIQNILSSIKDKNKWNRLCDESETITLKTIGEFHNNNDRTIKKKVTLAKNNVLIQKEHEIIDTINRDLFDGKGMNITTLCQLKNWQYIGKSNSDILERERIKQKIKASNYETQEHIEWRNIEKEINQRNLTAAASLYKNGMTPDMTRIIISKYLISTEDVKKEFKIQKSLDKKLSPQKVFKIMNGNDID
jgi:hypothetical protein